MVRSIGFAWLLAACASGPVPPDPQPSPAAVAARPAMLYRTRPASPPPDPARKDKVAALVPELDKLFAEDVARNDYPGMGVGIVLDGELVYARGFGARSLKTRAPFDADTVFRIASVTKSLTAMAVFKLRDEGRLGLDVPAVRYYPPLARLAYPTRDSPPITVRQLMTHGSGLPEDNFWVDVSIDLSDAELQALVASGMSFSRAPDTAFEYSNVGWALLGKIIERASGMPAREYIRRELLGPLGMSASGWEVDEIARDRLAVGYRGADGYRGKDKRKNPAPIQKDGVFDVAGGLYTTVRDMGRYMAFHLSAWPPRDAPDAGPLRRSSLREMHQGTRRGSWSDFLSALLHEEGRPLVQVSNEGIELASFSYGGGLITATTCADEFRVEHSGGLPGYSTALLLLPESGFGIVVFINDERVHSAPHMAALAMFRKAGLLTRHKVSPSPLLVDAAAGVNRLLASWDPAEAARIFEPTFFAYQSADKLGAQLRELADRHGRCRPDGVIHAPNWLRGRWRLACERGTVTFAAALSPRARPRLQALVWDSHLPPNRRMRQAAATLVGLIARWNAAAARQLFESGVDMSRTRKALAHLAVEGGSCRLGPVKSGDGASEAVFELRCRDAPLLLSLSLDEKTGRVKNWRGYPPRAPDSPNCAR
jgi:CubicO group peptidase (beta-lactamase class C family)